MSLLFLANSKNYISPKKFFILFLDLIMIIVILTINEQSMIHYLSTGEVKGTTDMEEVLSEGEWGLNDL